MGPLTTISIVPPTRKANSTAYQPTRRPSRSRVRAIVHKRTPPTADACHEEVHAGVGFQEVITEREPGGPHRVLADREDRPVDHQPDAVSRAPSRWRNSNRTITGTRSRRSTKRRNARSRSPRAPGQVAAQQAPPEARSGQALEPPRVPEEGSRRARRGQHFGRAEEASRVDTPLAQAGRTWWLARGLSARRDRGGDGSGPGVVEVAGSTLEPSEHGDPSSPDRARPQPATRRADHPRSRITAV